MNEERILTVQQAMDALSKLPPDKEIIVFADGHIFPIWVIQKSNIEDKIEIGCGWEPLEDE